ncbi:MAG: hypothetical protein QOE63_1561 [Acidimicrobiaceae bacterium]
MPELPSFKSEDITKAVKDALYVSVGLGVLAFQKAQVQRQELRKQLKGQVGDARTQLSSVTKLVDERVKLVEERLAGVESRVEALLDQVEERLPAQAKEITKQARTAAKDARTQVRELVRSN